LLARDDLLSLLPLALLAARSLLVPPISTANLNQEYISLIVFPTLTGRSVGTLSCLNISKDPFSLLKFIGGLVGINDG
jgi:hypothetical protein